MKHSTRTVTMFAIICALALAMPGVVHAESSSSLQSKLDSAKAELDKISGQIAAKGEELNDIKYHIEETQQQIDNLNVKIEAKQKKIDQGKAQVSTRVVSDYKNGATSILQIIFNADSFNDLINRFYLIQRSNKKDVEIMDDFIAAKKDLQKDKQEAQSKMNSLKDLQQKEIKEQESLKESEAKKKSYVDSLSQELKNQLEKERKEALEKQRRESEAAARAAREAAQEAKQDVNNGGNGNGKAGRVTGVGRQAIINAAISQLGVPYVYGAYSPGSALDCSGFTKYCYMKAGISLPHSAAGQRNTLRPISSSQMKPGDLIFWIGGVSMSLSGNHVAIYAGNGMIYHANGTSVVYSSLKSSFTSVGTAF